MPLRVHCPNSCIVRMSSNRAGRIVRCPACKSAIRIPEVSHELLALGGAVDCQARIAIPKTGLVEADPAIQSGNVPGNEAVAETESQIKQSRAQSRGAPVKGRLPVPAFQPRLTRPVISDNTVDEVSVGGENAVTSNVEVDLESDVAELDQSEYEDDVHTLNEDGYSEGDWIDGDDVAAPEAFPAVQARTAPPEGNPMRASSDGYASAATERVSSKTPSERAVDEVNSLQPSDSALDTLETESLSSKSLEGEQAAEFVPAAVAPSRPPVIHLGDFDDEPIVEEKDWQQRLENANADRRTLAKVFAMCLSLVALINMAPAIYYWYQWNQQFDAMPIPRWIYLLVFVGVIHLIYAVFLSQISDWSAMRAVSVAMLAMAFVFGGVSTGLLVGGTGALAGFLGLPFALSRQACIWCVAMLCLATLMSYWGGKEALNWERAERLIKDIIARSSTA